MTTTYRASVIHDRCEVEPAEFDDYSEARDWGWERLRTIVNWGERATLTITKDGLTVDETELDRPPRHNNPDQAFYAATVRRNVYRDLAEALERGELPE